MIRSFVGSLVCLVLVFPVTFASAQIVDARRQDEFDLKRAELLGQKEPDPLRAAEIDEDKFEAAHERLQQRREAAMAARVGIRGDRGHVYPIGRTIPVPVQTRPFAVPNIPLPAGGTGFRGGGVAAGGNAAGGGLVVRNFVPRGTVLFLKDEGQSVTNVKTAVLRAAGFRVLAPNLPDDDFAISVLEAAEAIRTHRPDVIVGDTRGGAIAINLDVGATPVVLLAPAWKQFGLSTNASERATILHSESDRIIPFADSEELLLNSGLGRSALIRIGRDHQLEDSASLRKLVEVCWESTLSQ